jgi:hypothetical protein
MSLRSIPLFDAGGRPTAFLMVQWAKRGALQPLMARVSLVEADGTANPMFRARWAAAFPSRQRLPTERVADPQGRGTDAFYDVFL